MNPQPQYLKPDAEERGLIACLTASLSNRSAQTVLPFVKNPQADPPEPITNARFGLLRRAEAARHKSGFGIQIFAPPDQALPRFLAEKLVTNENSSQPREMLHWIYWDLSAHPAQGDAIAKFIDAVAPHAGPPGKHAVMLRIDARECDSHPEIVELLKRHRGEDFPIFTVQNEDLIFHWQGGENLRWKQDQVAKLVAVSLCNKPFGELLEIVLKSAPGEAETLRGILRDTMEDFER